MKRKESKPKKTNQGKSTNSKFSSKVRKKSKAKGYRGQGT